jgi:type I restriction enzyme M protein
MADRLGSREFAEAIHGIPGPHLPADLALTIARMLAAGRLWPKGRDGISGFLDQGRELTRADWLAIVDVLAKRWKGGKGKAENPFATPAERPPPSPGTLEQLRRVVLSFAAKEEGYSVPAWLVLGVLDLAGRHGFFSLGLNPELREFVVDVTATTPKSRVFCAYNNSGGIALQLAAKGAEVTLHVETVDAAALYACLAVAAELRVQVRHGDPMELARADQKAHALLPDVFNVSIVIPPFNARFTPEDDDAFGTGLPLPPSIESAGLALALARGQNAALCLLPPSFLFRASKADQAFKERAIRDYGLETIVGLPRGIFGSTSLAGALVIFRPKQAEKLGSGKPQDIFVVDAREERNGAATDGRLPEDLAALVRARDVTPISLSVPVSDLATNDFNLSVERYVLPPEALRIRELTSAAAAAPLDDLVELYRPQAIPGSKSDAAARGDIVEVGVADIDEAGVIRNPSKMVSVAPNGEPQVRRARLERGDVLLVVKGSVGKVGFVREIPDGTTWLANQSFVILRLRRHAPVTDPRVLFRFLTSNLGQTTLQSLRVGSAVPGLQMADVRRLPIVIPDRQEQDAISKEVENLFVLQDRIGQLQAELVNQQGRIWPENAAAAVSRPRPQPENHKAKQLARKTAF